MGFLFERGIQTTMLQHSLGIFPTEVLCLKKNKSTQQQQNPPTENKVPPQTSLYPSYLGSDIAVQKQDRENFCD